MRNAECGVARRAFDSALRTPHSAFAVGGGCEEWSARRHHGGGSRDADRDRRGRAVGGPRGTALRRARGNALRSHALPEPHRGGDPRLPAPGPPRGEARQAARPLLAARRHQCAVRARGRRARSRPRGLRPRRCDDGLGAGRGGLRGGAGRRLPEGGAARARSRARARRVPGRGELQHRDRVRLHRPQLDQRDELCLGDDAVAPTEVGYVNAHGSSTPLNDTTETTALKQVFGEHAYRLTVSGTKGYYGHALGASGAIEAAICALAMERRWLPPTLNLERPDPACDLDCLPREGPAAAPGVLVPNSVRLGRL